jgi:NADH:ubiquinone oxidoreductase subunit K
MDLTFYIIAAVALLLVTGLYCILLTKNLLRILIGLEILMKAVTLLLITAGYLTGWNTISQSFVITLIIIEVVVMVIACGLIIGIYRYNDTLSTKKLKNLKG